MRTLVLLTALLCPSLARAGERTTEGVGLTIYSSPFAANAPRQVWNARAQRWEMQESGYAVVKEWRKLRLEQGRNTVRFTDVAARIDATTVHFRSLADPAGTYVMEQNFEYDLVSAEKILSRYIDRELSVDLEGGKTVVGTLLSFDGAQIVLKTEDPATPIQILQRGGNVKGLRFGALPGGLITKPTLLWLLDVKKAGEQLAKVTYQTTGLSWAADYSVVLSPDDSLMDLSGWVTITNQSGARYEDAELKLVAGDVHRATEPGRGGDRDALASKSRRSEADGGFEQKAFFEYHLYTLGRRTTLPDSSIKQMELLSPAEGVPVRKIFLYYGGVGGQPYGGQPYFDRNFGITSNPKVDIFLQFRNGREQGLGKPFPAGRVRVYKKDEADGALEFIGEDAIDHTPKDEKVLLKLGSAFDLVGERKQTDFQVDTRAHWLKESFEIRLRNHKDVDVEVIVKENLYRWSNWKLEANSHEFTKEDARTIQFAVKVPKDGETVVTYSVRYTW